MHVTCGQVKGFGAAASLHIQGVPLGDPSGRVSNMHPQPVPPIRHRLNSQAVINVPGACIVYGDQLMVAQVLTNGCIWVSWRIGLQVISQCLQTQMCVLSVLVCTAPTSSNHQSFL